MNIRATIKTYARTTHRWMLKTEWLKTWGDILQKWFTVIAIIGGSIWAYYNFSITDTSGENIEIKILASSYPYNADSRLLVVTVKPKNIGKVPTEARHGGFNLEIRRVGTGLATGHIDPEKMPLVEKTNIDKKYGEYILEPGVEYEETEGFIVPKGNTYLISSQFDLSEEGGTEVDTRVFSKVD